MGVLISAGLLSQNIQLKFGREHHSVFPSRSSLSFHFFSLDPNSLSILSPFYPSISSPFSSISLLFLSFLPLSPLLLPFFTSLSFLSLSLLSPLLPSPYPSTLLFTRLPSSFFLPFPSFSFAFCTPPFCGPSRPFSSPSPFLFSSSFVSLPFSFLPSSSSDLSSHFLTFHDLSSSSLLSSFYPLSLSRFLPISYR